MFIPLRSPLPSSLYHSRACEAISRSWCRICHHWHHCHTGILPRWCILPAERSARARMETVAQLQHVGGNWQFHKGERLLLCPAVEAEDHSQGGISAGRDSSHDGSTTIVWSEEVKITNVKVVLGSLQSLLSDSGPLAGSPVQKKSGIRPWGSRNLYTHPPVQTLSLSCILFLLHA